MYHYAYLHGFASGSLSSKGQLFKALFAEHGVTMHTPDLNVPDFGRLTVTGALEAVDALVASQPDGKWRFVGSSMGGWLASLWAARNPEQVDSMCLLCPGFNLLERWPEMIGAQAVDEWERQCGETGRRAPSPVRGWPADLRIGLPGAWAFGKFVLVADS